jgi:FkbM family methyltransferase
MKVLLFARRALRAAQHGFLFKGTSRTTYPRGLRVAGRMRPMTSPAERMTVHDLIDVVLDDCYGLRRLSSPPSTILDVGANIGVFSVHAQDRFPQATIHAYEPDPGTFAYLERNASKPGVALFNAGVAAAAGRAEMVQRGQSVINQTRAVEGGPVPLTSLAEAVQRLGGSVDLLKIDCEGFEWDIMSDPRPFAAVRTMRMEYHLVDGRRLDDLRSAIATLDHRITHLAPNESDGFGFGIVWTERQL